MPPEPVTFEARNRGPLRLTIDQMQQARASGAVVVDARPRHQYVGAPDAPDTGHMPGARPLPYQELVDGATGLFQSPDAIRRLVSAIGIDPDDPPPNVVTTCGAGLSATLTMLVPELVGVRVRGVYDGGWNEWSADPTRPVAYGGEWGGS